MAFPAGMFFCFHVAGSSLFFDMSRVQSTFFYATSDRAAEIFPRPLLWQTSLTANPFRLSNFRSSILFIVLLSDGPTLSWKDSTRTFLDDFVTFGEGFLLFSLTVAQLPGRGRFPFWRTEFIFFFFFFFWLVV